MKPFLCMVVMGGLEPPLLNQWWS